MSLRHGLWRWRRWLGLGGVLLLRVLLAVGQAQVKSTLTPDGTLGTAVLQRGTLYEITGGTRPGNGPNLFHSFDRFSVGTGDTARFSGPAGIENILSRVTGGQQSVIDGRLQSTIPGANLFLLNPSGVLFGPKATLDISGSFHVSTADVLRFADGATFAARLSAKTTLTVAPPVAFGFLSAQPAPITLQGSTLHVSEGQALSVVGGDMQIVGGKLVAPGGRIQVASVASPGDVLFRPVGWAPELRVDAVMRLGRLELSQGALLDASGNGGGVVLLRSGRLLVDGSNIFADNTGPLDGTGLGLDLRIAADAAITNGSFITTDSYIPNGSLNMPATLGAGHARELRLMAGNVSLDRSTLGSRPFSSGAGGDVTLHVDSLTLTGGAQIDTGTRGSGHGGTLTVAARDTLTLAGTSPDGQISSGIFASAEGKKTGAGAAGSIVVQAPRVALTGGAQIFGGTMGPGPGGPVQVTATDTLTLTGTNPDGTHPSGILASAQGKETGAGAAGSIVVQAPRVALTGGAQIGSLTFGPGPGGPVQVTATDTLTLAGTGPDGKHPSGILASAQGMETGAGAAGSIVVQAPRVALTGGAQIGSGTFGPGPGGPVQVTATDTLTLAGTGPNGTLSSGIFASARGTGARAGDAGAVVVEARTIQIADGAVISSDTRGPGRGGPVQVTATDTLTLAGTSPDGTLSRIDSSTAGDGHGGNITVHAQRIALSDGGTISTRSAGQGNAGNIVLQAGELFQSRHGAVTTEAEQADGGNITLTTGSLVELHDSQLTATVKSGVGKGGNITLDPQFLVLQRSQVRADAFGGPGGNVHLVAEVFLADPASQVSASSALNIPGTVNIQAPITNLSGALVPLPQAFARATELLSTRCAERLRAGTVSTLVVRGRDGVPARPGGVVPLPLALVRPEASEAEGPAGPPEAPAVSRVGALYLDDHGQAQVRGWQGQGFVPAVLALDCAK
jgi:filamentous hemagglutinin family protein